MPTATEQDYKYAAFISYRHEDVSRKSALWLHRALERYRIPQSLRKLKGCPSRIGRVFRDEEELAASTNLSLEIERALSASKYVIVVCTKRTPESRWVNEEIRRFQEMGRGNRILTLLVDGEPSESFPAALFDKTGHADSSDDNATIIEPLAADVRDVHREGSHYVRRQAKLRLIATILEIDYDDLFRRDARARIRRAILMSILSMMLMLLTGGLAVYATNQQRLAEQATNDALTAQSETAKALKEVTRQKEETERRRKEAVEANARAEAEAEKVRRQLAEQYLQNGLAAANEDRHAESALWYCKAREIDPRDPRRDRIHDLRIALALGGCAPLLDDGGLYPKEFSIEFVARLQILNWQDKTAMAKFRFGQPVREVQLPVQVGSVLRNVISPSGKRLAASLIGGLVKVWDIETGSTIATLPPLPAMASSLEFSPNDGLLLVGCEDGSLLFHSFDERKVPTPPPSTARIMATAFGPNGRLVAIADESGFCRIWSLENDAPVGLPMRHQSRINQVQFDRSGTLIVTGSDDKSARVWEALSGIPVTPCLEHQGDVGHIHFSHDGLYVTTNSSDLQYRHWAIHPHSALKIVVPPDESNNKIVEPVSDLTLSRDWTRMAIVAGDMVRICDTSTSQEMMRLSGGGKISHAMFSPDGTRLLTRHRSSKSARLWDLKTGTPIGSHLGHTDVVFSAEFSPNGEWVATCSADKSLCIWNAGDGSLHRQYPHDQAVYDFDFTSDSRFIVSAAGADCRVVDLTSSDEAIPPKQLKSPSSNFLFASSVDFSPTETLLFLGDHVYQWPSFEEVPEFSTHKYFGKPEFSRDGRRMALKIGKTDIRVWDCEKNSAIWTHLGSENVDAFALSPDGTLLATAGGNERALRIWDVDGGRVISPPFRHGGPVKKMIWNPESTAFISASDDGCVRCWQLPVVENTGDRTHEAILLSSHQIDSRGQIVPLKPDAVYWKSLLEEYQPVHIAAAEHHDRSRLAIEELVQLWRWNLSESWNDALYQSGALLVRSGDVTTFFQSVISDPKKYSTITSGLEHVIRLLKRVPTEDVRWQSIAALDLVQFRLLEQRFADAVPLARRAVELSDQTNVVNRQIAARTALASALVQSGGVEEGMAIFAEIKEIATRTGMESSRTMVNSLQVQGLFLFQQSRFSEAEQCFRQMLLIAEEQFDPNYAGLGPLIETLINSLVAQKKFSEIESLSERQIAIYSTAFSLRLASGPIARAQLRIGAVAVGKRDFEKGEKFLEKCYPVLREGGASQDAVDAALLLGFCYQSTDRPEKAERCFLEELEMRRKLLPQGQSAFRESLMRTAVILLKNGKTSDAEPLFQAELELAQKEVPKDELAVANAQSGLGRCLLTRGNIEESELLLREALAVRTEKLGPSSEAARLSATSLIELLEKTDRANEAAALRKKHGIDWPAEDSK